MARLRCIANLNYGLPNGNYNYILASRFQGDLIECQFSKYGQLSGGSFLVSLREANNLEKILSLNSIIKANLNFEEENIYAENITDSVTECHTRLHGMTN